jgi:hypothetical protein
LANSDIAKEVIVPIIVPVETFIEVEKIVTQVEFRDVERVIEREKILEIPVEKIVEVVKEIYVDRIVEVEKIVQVEVEKIVNVEV